jgi:hypothetical protein
LFAVPFVRVSVIAVVWAMVPSGFSMPMLCGCCSPIQGVVKTQDDLDAQQARHRITQPSQFVRCQQPFRQGKLRQKPPPCVARITFEPRQFAQ